MSFELCDKGYFKNHGVDVMAFDDFYPAGHQSGITVIMHGNRVVANGDIRFEQTPGQWQPVPKQVSRKVDKNDKKIITNLEYPDMEAHLHGFNPIIYPDFEFKYEVVAESVDEGIKVSVSLDRPVPEEFLGKLSFNLELFPGILFGKSYICDGVGGVFPRQANAPTKRIKTNYDNTGKMRPRDYAHADREKLAGYNKGYNPIIADDIIAEPYACGHKFTVCPEEELLRFSVECNENLIRLYDGRMNHNNGWFVLNIEVPAGKTENAIEILIKPNIVEDWISPAIVQVSQVGFHPNQPKKAVIELDRRDTSRKTISLMRVTEDGEKCVYSGDGKEWGEFLRYRYLTFDFDEIKAEGLYRIRYGNSLSELFKIAGDVYERGVWQPVLEYFLPVQMCHMRVNEKYRVWHGLCHHDDARMAPVNYEQFDGAAQGPSTMSHVQPGEHVPGLSAGGWHDAGDFDLRIESQTGEMYNLSAAYEEFNVFLDETTIDQKNQVVEIHQPDGYNDVLQQIEHGAISVIGGYKSLGRLYHEVMCGDLRQYVLLGDPVNMTSGVADGTDERLVFTEDNPTRELTVAAQLACTYRALKDLNASLAEDCLNVSKELFDVTGDHSGDYVIDAYDPGAKGKNRIADARIHAASELLISTSDEKYRNFIINNKDYIVANVNSVGWMICRCKQLIKDDAFEKEFRNALLGYREELRKLSKETPYGIPYRPNIWGAGWGIQEQGAKYYFLYKAYPDIFDAKFMYDSLQFILGCHPGSNNESFASGIGTKSTTIAYGINRADWSYIPGGVVSGTALIRPDLPELLDFPYLWQQKEYVLGGGSSHYMFLVLAVKAALNA